MVGQLNYEIGLQFDSDKRFWYLLEMELRIIIKYLIVEGIVMSFISFKKSVNETNGALIDLSHVEQKRITASTQGYELVSIYGGNTASSSHKGILSQETKIFTSST